jgi:hypothetical protein
MFPCYGMWFRINTCLESPLGMYIWTSWFAHFLRQTKLEEDYPPIERERERERERVFETGHLDISQRLLASQRAKEGLAFSFSVDTEIHLSSSTMNTWETSFTGMEIEQPQRVVVVLMSSWHAVMGCDWIFKPYFFEWRKIGWGPQCKNLESYWCGDGFFDSFVI